MHAEDASTTLRNVFVVVIDSIGNHVFPRLAPETIRRDDNEATRFSRPDTALSVPLKIGFRSRIADVVPRPNNASETERLVSFRRPSRGSYRPIERIDRPKRLRVIHSWTASSNSV